MRVGLLADTHDHVPAVRELVRQLVDRGAEMLLHAGDFCSPFILDTLHEVAGVRGLFVPGQVPLVPQRHEPLDDVRIIRLSAPHAI